MANSTVYPYGTQGTLPASIGLINDLKTGGADKALTAAQGVILNEMILSGMLSVGPDSDKLDKSFNSSGSIVTDAGQGIATIPILAGRGIKIFGGPLRWGTSYSGICFSTDGTTWTPLFYGSHDSDKWYHFKAESDGYVGVALDSTQKVSFVYEDITEPLVNAESQKVFPALKMLSTIESGSNVKNFIWMNTTGYKSIYIGLVGNNSIRTFFPLINESWAPVRMIGMKNGVPVKTTTTEADMVTTDSVLGKILVVSAAFKSGCDSVYWTFQKVNGYEDTDYDAFGILNTYCQEAQNGDIATVQNFIYENYYPVGSVVKYRSGKVYKVVKDKSANSYASAGGVVETTLIKTDNLPIANSMAELVSVMNKMSYNLGAVDSSWVNPYGGSKYAENNNLNRTTAKDMCRIMAYVYRYCPVVLSVMSTETAKVHIYGANDRDKTLKNNTWDKLASAYTSLHGSGTMPYSIIANKPGATVNTTTAGDGVSNTGFSIVALAKVGDKLVVADAAYLSTTDYTTGRTNRAKAMIQLLDIAKAIIDGGSATGMSDSYIERGAVAVINPDGLDFIYTKNGDTLFQPASTSKVMGAVAMLSVLSNLEEYHSIWNDPDELMNDSGSDASSSETHIAKAGDVESVSTSLHISLLVSNGANTMALARMAGEKIIRSKEQFLNI